MKAALFLLAMLAVLAVTTGVVAQSIGAGLTSCPTTQSYTLNVTTGTFGCLGAGSRVTISWVFSNDAARVIDYTIDGYSDSSVTLYAGDNLVARSSPNSAGSYYFAKGTVLTIVYYSGPTSQSQYGVNFKVSLGPDVTTLVSQQTTHITKEQQGGFVYFMLPYQSLGRLFNLDVEIFSYQGLREPSVFVSRNRVPTLEKYDFTNATVSTGTGRETCLIFIADPVAASYLVGVFLYGSAASMSVSLSWNYNPQYLTSGVKVQKVFNGIDYYQILVPVNTSKLVFQISRQLPGGYPVAYIAQGSVPSATNYQWIADTQQQSYISITIPNPNPAGSTGPNPGNYLFAISSGGQSSGYIIQADWA